MPGVSTRSPGFMAHFWPSTVVKAPSPWSMNLIAVGEWRCAGATSPGSRYWIASTRLWATVRSGTPGLCRRSTRRSAPRCGLRNSLLSRRSGSMSRQRQWRGWVAVGLGGMSGPGRDHGASSPAALNRAQYASISSTVRVVWTAMVASCLDSATTPTRGCGPCSGAEHAALPAVELHADRLAHLEYPSGIDLRPDARAVVECHVTVDDVAEEGHF